MLFIYCFVNDNNNSIVMDDFGNRVETQNHINFDQPF